MPFPEIKNNSPPTIHHSTVSYACHLPLFFSCYHVVMVTLTDATGRKFIAIYLVRRLERATFLTETSEYKWHYK